MYSFPNLFALALLKSYSCLYQHSGRDTLVRTCVFGLYLNWKGFLEGLEAKHGVA